MAEDSPVHDPVAPAPIGASRPRFVSALATPAVLGATVAVGSWLLGSGVHWRLDAGAALAFGIVRGWRSGAAAILGAVLATAAFAPSAAAAAAFVLVPIAFGLLGVRGREWLAPIDEREPAFIARLTLASGLLAIPLALVLAVSLASPDWPWTALFAWVAVVAGVLATAPLAVHCARESLSQSGLAAIVAIGVLLVAAIAGQETLASMVSPALLLGGLAAVAVWFALRGSGTLALLLALAAPILAAVHPIEPIAATALACAALALVTVTLYGQQARHVHAEAERRADRGLFDAMMRFLPVGLFRTDPTGALRYANPMFRALTGIAGDSMVGWRDVVHSADRAQVEAAWQKFQRGQAAFDESYRVQPLGNLRWVQVRISPEYEHGNVAGYIGTITDITNQKLAEAARNRTEAHSRAILDSAVDGIVSIDASGTIRSFNHGAERMLGYRSEDVIGRNVAMLMPSPHAERHDDYLRRYLDSGDARIIGIGRELEARCRDGGLLPVHLAVSEVTVDGARTFTGIMRDISRDRAAAEEIRRQHELLSVTVQNAPTGIATYRFDEPLASANRALEVLTGYEPAALLAMRFTDLIDPDDRSEFDRLAVEARAGREAQFSVKVRIVRADGTRFPVAIYGAVTHDAGGAPDRVIVQAVDLTAELQSAEQERAHREELTHFARLSTLGEMTAGIAHEINQPLTAIALYAQSAMRMLDAGLPDAARLREAMEKLKTQSLRAGAVIDRIQRLVRHREGVRESLAMNELVTDILHLAESDARVNDMKIELDLGDDLPLVAADPIQIQQVLLNLVRNAIDAMRGIACRNGRSVLIRTRRTPEDRVRVAVIDSGTGVPAEFESQLFTPFATTKEHGMGMGLSICHSIIEDHGGQMGFANNPDHGATFHFELPQEYFSEES
jgi:two-component system sensor kinase FixL